MMSSEEFEKLHEMFVCLYDELKLIPEKAQSCHGEDRKKWVRTFDERHGEAEEVLQGMEDELRFAPASYRSAMSTKVRMYRRDLGKLHREIKNSAPVSGSSSHHGIYAAENQRSTHVQSQRALLLQGTDSLNSASESIARSQRIAVETEQIGTDIIEELGGQKEQLNRARDKLVNTGENLSRSRKILRAMSRRIMTNKLLLAIVILMELAILGAVVYLKFFRKKK